MGQILVTFRMDEELKRDVEDTCKKLGLTMTAAFTLYAKKLAREKRIPFDVSITDKKPEKSLFFEIMDAPEKISPDEVMEKISRARSDTEARFYGQMLNLILEKKQAALVAAGVY